MNKHRLRFTSIFVMLLSVFNTLWAQDDYDFYLQKARQRLTEGDCTRAEASYNTYKDLAHKTDKEIERLIEECKNGGSSAPGGDLPFTVEGVTFTMKLVEGGTFWMGAQISNPNGQNYDSHAVGSESPVHSVTLSSYYMGETEVTQALWKAVMGDNPSYFKGDNLPVEEVSWNDCQEFIRKLNQKTGKNFRLPTEAEWEFAARGKTQTSLYSGESIDIRGKYNSPNLDKLAWYLGNCGRNYTSSAGCDVAHRNSISYITERQYNDSYGGTHPVGKNQPNAYGLYDMLGNVWEWCSDMFDDYGSGSQTHPNPQSTSKGFSDRVIRGGCWFSKASHCRVSKRGRNSPDYRCDQNGFRLCLPR